MDITRVNGLMDTFEGLTPEEKGEALKRLLSSIGRDENITVEVDESKPDHFTITGDANEVGRAFLSVVTGSNNNISGRPNFIVNAQNIGAVEGAGMGSIERAADLPYQTPEQSSAWGEDLVSMVESLDFGDYSKVTNSVEYIRQQRAAQQARRLGKEG